MGEWTKTWRRCSLLAGVCLMMACGSDVATFGGGAGGQGSASTTVGGKDDSGSTGATTGGGDDTGPKATGDPIDAPTNEWTWVPFDNAFCANGQSTGIGVNLSDTSDDVVIFLMGGGACWDALTCYLASTAVNISSGYGQGQFDNDAKGFLNNSLMFDRDNSKNLFRDASYVFVPYCTGDVHAGNNVAIYNGKETMHVGAVNMEAYLQRIVPTFADAKRVVLSGSSAGGFGAGMHWGRTQELFGSKIPVFLIDDSGPTLPNPYLKESLENTWKESWNLQDIFPEECTECVDNFDALFSFYADKYPNRRGALLSHTRDNVISYFFQISQQQVSEGLDALAKERLEPHEGLQYYFVDGGGHVLLGDPDTFDQNGVPLLGWLEDMLSGSPDWQSVAP